MTGTLRVAREDITRARDIEATRLVAHVCAHLPVGFWQRRLAARAFGTPVLPPVDPDWNGGAAQRRLGDEDMPLLALYTSRAVWALSPGGRHALRDVVSALRNLASREFVGIVAVMRYRERRSESRLLAAPRPVGGGAPCVGALSWHEAAELIDDGLGFAGSPRALSRLQVARTWLRVLSSERSPDHIRSVTDSANAARVTAYGRDASSWSSEGAAGVRGG